MKTRQQWSESKKNLSEFLNVGDTVCEDIADEMMGVVPPLFCKGGFQVGEAMDHVGGRATYQTFIKNERGDWIFKGELHRLKN